MHVNIDVKLIIEVLTIQIDIHVENAKGGIVKEACNDECLNRQIYIECSNCEWNEYCTNRNFVKV